MRGYQAQFKHKDALLEELRIRFQFLFFALAANENVCDEPVLIASGIERNAL